MVFKEIVLCRWVALVNLKHLFNLRAAGHGQKLTLAAVRILTSVMIPCHHMFPFHSLQFPYGAATHSME